MVGVVARMLGVLAGKLGRLFLGSASLPSSTDLPDDDMMRQSFPAPVPPGEGLGRDDDAVRCGRLAGIGTGGGSGITGVPILIG